MPENVLNNQRKIKIMVIEDSEVEAFILESLIADLDFVDSLTIYDKAKDAFNFVLKGDEDDVPDLVLLDLYLDQGDGYEFIDEMEFSAKFPNGFPFKIYILTNSRWKENEALFKSQKYATAFFEKPIDPKAFSEKVAEDFL